MFSTLKTQNGGIASFINSFANGRFAKYVYKVEIDNGLGPSTDGETQRVGEIYKTKLNCEHFNNFTRLGMARTILHEVLHAYMQAYLQQQGKQDFQQSFPNVIFAFGNITKDTHQEIAINYVTKIAETLREFDSKKQDIEYYKKLAWGGLYGIDAFKSKNSEEQTEIKNVVANEQYYSVDSKADKCSDNSVGTCN